MVPNECYYWYTLVKKNGAKYKKTEKSFIPMDDKFYSFQMPYRGHARGQEVDQLLPRDGQAS